MSSVSFKEALNLYKSGKHYEAHVIWEDLWRETPQELEKNFLKALVQLCAAHIKLKQKEPLAFERLLKRVDDLVQPFSGSMHSIDAQWVLSEAKVLRRQAQG